ncbi:MAG: hypothetical protein A3I44_06195 [Candidatus Sungbacteria bacterium RIFCSPLOWO2_02_FULL_51_17]|uniref:3D domain-containing protein n=1 Tax=Candidatus Sungbacteria bacterium RIFCSPHIGHO2_02_FULL_51_29 TaxID=1802273 RepID=A0A1G2KQB6_9BACT|nr:MAG: hypothetical protein A3C16_02570 [Candidatus Sungbacteria bacterium RIFCSPHIGHO2_02_FULL_51_29]OHA10367.1 MAG: hypothetical protein A3I44_06195 [Candidatus Sungbacteria bacterium RIFCSPLOWO2_02_FULL_51_17]
MLYIIAFLIMCTLYLACVPNLQEQATAMRALFERAPSENTVAPMRPPAFQEPIQEKGPTLPSQGPRVLPRKERRASNARNGALPISGDVVYSLLRRPKSLFSGYVPGIGGSKKGQLMVRVVASAYYGPRPGQAFYATGSYAGDIELNGRGKRTASGTRPIAYQTVAVDPTIFPYGTRFRIPGWGYGIAEDTGRDIRGLRVDLFKGHGEAALVKALYFGRRPITIEVMQGGR